MNKITINGGSLRYLSELPQFKNGLPDGIINKTKPDVGGTYIAANCDKNYIIVCPFKDLVDSIAADTNNKYEDYKQRYFLFVIHNNFLLIDFYN